MNPLQKCMKTLRKNGSMGGFGKVQRFQCVAGPSGWVPGGGDSHPVLRMTGTFFQGFSKQ